MPRGIGYGGKKSKGKSERAMRRDKIRGMTQKPSKATKKQASKK